MPQHRHLRQCGLHVVAEPATAPARHLLLAAGVRVDAIDFTRGAAERTRRVLTPPGQPLGLEGCARRGHLFHNGRAPRVLADGKIQSCRGVVKATRESMSRGLCGRAPPLSIRDSRPRIPRPHDIDPEAALEERIVAFHEPAANNPLEQLTQVVNTPEFTFVKPDLREHRMPQTRAPCLPVRKAERETQWLRGRIKRVPPRPRGAERTGATRLEVDGRGRHVAAHGPMRRSHRTHTSPA